MNKRLTLAFILAISSTAFGAEGGGRAFGTAMNPDLGANALFLYTKGNRGNYTTSPEPNGPSVQEIELSYSSDVDPYSKLKLNFSAHQEAGEWKFEPEEAYAETTYLPAVILRMGKIKAALGKHNEIHTHAFPFVDAPLANSVLLGEEGLNDVGLSVAYLAPLPWYSELVLQVFSGRTENSPGEIKYFNHGSANSSVQVAHFKNLVDLSDSLTGELGLSVARGGNEFADADGVNQIGNTDFLGADLTFKWRPVEGGKYQSFAWATEGLSRKVYRPGSSNVGQGIASWIQWQASERCWLQLRADYLETNDTDTLATKPYADEVAPIQRRYTALVGFNPSEFSGIRLQYSRTNDAREPDPEQKIYLQFSYTIGVHPAHSY